MTWGSTTVQTLGCIFKSDFWFWYQIDYLLLSSRPFTYGSNHLPQNPGNPNVTSQIRCSKISHRDLRPKAFQWASPWTTSASTGENRTQYSGPKVPAPVTADCRSQHKKCPLQGVSRSSSNTPGPNNKRENVWFGRWVTNQCPSA